MIRKLLALVIVLLSITSARAAPSWIAEAGAASDFPLASRGAAAPIIFAEQDAKVVAIAAGDLAADIERVTGRKPVVRSTQVDGHAVLVGTLGNSPLIDQLVAAGKLDVRELKGAWESFIITTVGERLVIVGSDRRGTAFGVYELSQAIGVSPWYWWADVTPDKKAALFVRAGARRFGPPSVKYRGIFINDEDWGLQPWAARTLEPENGGIGPKTYARVFELLLRLKANILWPAMHPGTPAFNADPRNAALADEYAIVMGSSHAEPMLRNNVSEWKAGADAYNYQSNPDGVLKYWKERVATNGRFENFYTIGMRGIHDSAMKGPKSVPDRIALMEKIFEDQRGLLAGEAPQLFCAYKEVLALYRQGMKVPDDVTIMWPDDNFGYIRGFANAGERARAGGFGVYYHLSYLGAPLSYLTLSTIPPALIWEEMSKAYDAGAQRIWIANVGDIKPAEIDTEFFLQMAWDHKRWTRETMPGFLAEWAAREFGHAHGRAIGAIMAEYYRLNFARKPEHLQWWLPKEAPRRSPLTAAESALRQEQFVRLRERTERLRAAIAPAKQDAFFELVAYPVGAAALANERFLEGERGNQAAALAAHARLERLTGHWNTALANGKWRFMMPQEPEPSEWRSLRASAWTMPQVGAAPAAVPVRSIEAERFVAARAGGGAAWKTIAGLGRSGEGAVGVFPIGAASVAPAAAPRLDYRIFAAAGKLTLQVHLLPTHAIDGGGMLRFAVGLDGAAPVAVALEVRDGGPEWAQGVLDGRRIASVTLDVARPGAHTLQLYGTDAGVIVDRIDYAAP
jgi:hypothetical protein